MSDMTPNGLPVPDLGPEFEALVRRKSDLMLEAHLLEARGETDEAANGYAEAATIEEKLAEWCKRQAFLRNAWVHQFSAVGCWARAGNYHEAITLSGDLLQQDDLPERLRQKVQEFAGVIRQRRAQFSAALALASSEAP